MSDDYGTNTIDLFRARKMKKEGGETCYVLLDIDPVENTTVEVTKVVAVCSTLEIAKKIQQRCSHRYDIVEFVIDPPLEETKQIYNGCPDLFPKLDVMTTSSEIGPDWREESYTDEQAERYIEREEAVIRRKEESDDLLSFTIKRRVKL